MSRQRWQAVVLVIGALVVPAQAQAQVQLHWKLREGDKFYLETTGTAKQTMKVMGTPIQQEVETTAVDSYKVVKKDMKKDDSMKKDDAKKAKKTRAAKKDSMKKEEMKKDDTMKKDEMKQN